MTNRRTFLKKSGMALASAALVSHFAGLGGCANNKPLSFGFQSWTLRNQLGEDLPGTLEMMAGMGYKEVEMCSPLGYTGTPFEKFNGMSATELRRIIEGAGLKCGSCHYNMGLVKDRKTRLIAWPAVMILPSFVSYTGNYHSVNYQAWKPGRAVGPWIIGGFNQLVPKFQMVPRHVHFSHIVNKTAFIE